MVLQAIKYSPSGASPASLEILDQLQLPHQSVYLSITSSEDAWHAIKQMKVRGAPAIAIVAALSLAVELSHSGTRKEIGGSARAIRDLIRQRLEHLESSRPTAVNLGDAVRKLGRIMDDVAKKRGADAATIVTAYVEAAERMLIDDVGYNEAIGKHGADWITAHTLAGQKRLQGTGELKVLTHCNTGCVISCPISVIYRWLSTTDGQIPRNSWLWYGAGYHSITSF